jgi:hypothetical protein
MFLIPIASFGYSVWETKKTEREEQHRNNRLGEAAATSRQLLVVEGPPTSEAVQTIGNALTSDSLESLSLEELVDEGSGLIIAEAVADDEPLPSASQGDTHAITPDCHEQVEASPVREQGVKVDAGRSMTTSETLEPEEVQSPPPSTQPAKKGIFHFLREAQKVFAENPEPWRIKSNADTLTYEVLGHQGKRKE